MWGSDRLRAGRQEVGKCSTRGESWGMYITFASAKIANKAEPTLALKPRGDVTRNPKQGYQWPPKKDMCPPKTLKKKKKVVNALVASLFVYKMMVLPKIPDTIVKTVDNKIGGIFVEW